MVEISIILPVYAGEKFIQNSVRTVYKKLLSYFGDTSKFEIIVVVDGFVDRTYEKVKELSKEIKNLKIIGYRKNGGKGKAVKQGILVARGKYIGFLDADLDIPVEKFIEGYELLRSGKADVVIGSKWVKGAVVVYPVFRKILSIMFGFMIRMFFPFLGNIRDTQVGCKIFTRKAAKTVFRKICVKRFAFDVEVLVVARLCKFRVKEIPIVILYNGNSTMSSSLKLINSIFYMLRDVLAIAYRTYILRYYTK